MVSVDRGTPPSVSRKASAAIARHVTLQPRMTPLTSSGAVMGAARLPMPRAETAHSLPELSEKAILRQLNGSGSTRKLSLESNAIACFLRSLEFEPTSCNMPLLGFGNRHELARPWA